MELATYPNHEALVEESEQTPSPTGLKPSQIPTQEELKQTLETNSKELNLEACHHTNFKQKLQHFIGMHSEAPNYLKDNDYIISGYRINFHSFGKVIKSLFLKHNESFNIWSHLIGFICVLLVILFLFFKIMPEHQLGYFINHHSVKDGLNYTNISQDDRFSALLNKLPYFDGLESAWKDKEAKKEVREYIDGYTQELNNKLQKAIADVELFVNGSLASATTPQSVKSFLQRIEDEINQISKSFSEWKTKVDSSVSDIVIAMQISNASLILKSKLGEVQQLISKIFYEKLDSKDYDWIDVYKYIDHRDHSLPPLQNVHRWPIFVFLFSAAFCLMGSATFHLVYCMSVKVSNIFNRLDYAGISILITGSCFPPVVYGFYCQQEFITLYLSILSVASLIVFFVSLGDTIHKDENRHLKGLMYAGLGIFSGFPLIHLVYNEFRIGPDTDYLPFSASLPYYLAMGACYLIGVYIYVKKIPEKYIPGKVDNCGHSHNIWHVFILLAIVMHYFGSFENYYTRMEIVCRA